MKGIARKDGKQEANGTKIGKTQGNRHIQVPVLILPETEIMTLTKYPKSKKMHYHSSENPKNYNRKTRTKTTKRRMALFSYEFIVPIITNN